LGNCGRRDIERLPAARLFQAGPVGAIDRAGDDMGELAERQNESARHARARPSSDWAAAHLGALDAHSSLIDLRNLERAFSTAFCLRF
jgi:hypothetical protein